MKKRSAAILCLIVLVISGVGGFAVGYATGAGQAGLVAVSAIANQSDAQLTEQENGDIILWIPNKTESAGYQPILVSDNSTNSERENNTTHTENGNAYLRDFV